MNNFYATPASTVVADAVPSDRAAFIRRTYLHLAGAVAAFIVFEFILFNSPVAPLMLNFLASSGGIGWLAVLGGFIALGWAGRSMAQSIRSPGMQYAGLALYVFGEAVIFVPLIYMAVFYSSANVLPTAALITTMLFGGLTTYALTTRKDFSFLRGALVIGSFVAIGLIVAGAIFGFDLGLVFSVGMVGLAGASVLYDTSKVVHYYHTDQHVAASIELFASVALMFWYVIRILMSLSRN